MGIARDFVDRARLPLLFPLFPTTTPLLNPSNLILTLHQHIHQEHNSSPIQTIPQLGISIHSTL